MIYPSLIAIAAFFVGHWVLSIFAQTFFLHRYGAHRMYGMSKGWERFFHLFTWLTQGASYLNPKGYAILHREHHAYSDTEGDPHSPHLFGNLAKMMWATKERYQGLADGSIAAEARFEGGYPEWPLVDRLANSWISRVGFGIAYTAFYVAFAPHWAFLLLLPIHYLMGPIQGAIVNWCGHKYGYRNFGSPKDRSRNTLVFDFVTFGELFQNNHHRFGMAPNFGARWFEVDPTWPVIWGFDKVGIIELPAARQRMRWVPADRQAPPAPLGTKPAAP